jgi:hypothetical protein
MPVTFPTFSPVVSVFLAGKMGLPAKRVHGNADHQEEY